MVSGLAGDGVGSVPETRSVVFPGPARPQRRAWASSDLLSGATLPTTAADCTATIARHQTGLRSRRGSHPRLLPPSQAVVVGESDWSGDITRVRLGVGQGAGSQVRPQTWDLARHQQLNQPSAIKTFCLPAQCRTYHNKQIRTKDLTKPFNYPQK